jgi:hypothetical protein
MRREKYVAVHSYSWGGQINPAFYNEEFFGVNEKLTLQ